MFAKVREFIRISRAKYTALSKMVRPWPDSSSQCNAMPASIRASTVKPFGGRFGESSCCKAKSRSSDEGMSGAYREPMYCITGNRYLRDAGSVSKRARK